MTWFLHALSLITLAALLGAVISGVLAFLERWTLAKRVAKASTLGSLAVFTFLAALLVLLSVAPSVIAPLLLRALPAGDPGDRARALAEWISEAMNGSVLCLPSALIGGIVWGVAQRRLRRLRVGQ